MNYLVHISPAHDGWTCIFIPWMAEECIECTKCSGVHLCARVSGTRSYIRDVCACACACASEFVCIKMQGWPAEEIGDLHMCRTQLRSHSFHIQTFGHQSTLSRQQGFRVCTSSASYCPWKRAAEYRHCGYALTALMYNTGACECVRVCACACE